MQKWEYLIVYLEDSDFAQDKPEVDVYMDADKFTDKLKTYGEAGWEMVTFQWEERGAKVALKRPATS